MIRPPRRYDSRGAVSLVGFLALLCGCGVLFLFWRFGRLISGWDIGLRLAIVAVAGVLTLWGLAQVVAAFLSGGRGGPIWAADSTGLPGTESSVARPRISWRGLLLALVGIGLIYFFWERRVLGWIAVAGMVAAAVFLVWGVTDIVASAASEKRSIRPQRLARLTLPGLVYLAMMGVFFVGSMLGHSNMLLLIFSLMAGPFVLNGWITFSMARRIEISRNVPESVMAGETVLVNVTLRNKKRLFPSWLMSAADHIAGGGGRLTGGVVFTRVPARSSRSESYRLRPMRRGIYHLGPLVVTTRFPLGLVERGVEFRLADRLVVYPRLGRLSPAWFREQLMASELFERQAPERGVYEDEFHRIREYRAGDNPRAIHWRSSARQGELMVREYHQSRDRDLALFLDLWWPRRPDEDDVERVELAVSFAATVCIEHIRQARDATVSLDVAGENRVHWEGGSGRTRVDSLLELLARIRAAPQADAAGLAEAAGGVGSRHVRKLFISTRPNVEARLSKRGGGARGTAAAALATDLPVIEVSWKTLDPVFDVQV